MASTGAGVKVASSAGRPTTLRHLLQLLYPLEVHQRDGDEMQDTDDTQKVTGPDNDDAASPETGSKPRCHSNRVASRNAREFVRLQSEKLNSFSQDIGLC